MVKKVLLCIGAMALAACGAALPPSVALPPSEETPSQSPTVVTPAPDCPEGEYTPPMRLTCEMAVDAALERAALTTSPRSITFYYGAYCPEGQTCPPPLPGRGYVLIEMGDGAGDVFLDIRLDGPGALAGPVRAFPPNLMPSGPFGSNEVVPDPAFAEPPAATINGVAGDPTSWCGWGACVDGFRRSPRGLPEARPPFLVKLPEGAHIESASAFVAGAPDDHHYLEVRGGQLGGFPPGTVMLSVSLRWENGHDAEYYWAISSADQ